MKNEKVKLNLFSLLKKAIFFYFISLMELRTYKESKCKIESFDCDFSYLFHSFTIPQLFAILITFGMNYLYQTVLDYFSTVEQIERTVSDTSSS
jgi:hypothetical protein